MLPTSAKYIHLCFDTKRIPDLFDTNHDVMDRERMEDADLKLKFKLVHSTVTAKFLGIVSRFLAANKSSGCPDRIGYNYYIKRNPKYILNAKRELNDTIERINAKKLLQIPARFKVDPNVFEGEHDSLNELHFIFESEKKKKYEGSDEINALLWRINNLVHVLEGVVDMDWTKYRPTWQMTNYLHSDMKIPLEPNDYKAFRKMEEGLYVDYNTIGKDLIDCFRTNDIELVRKRRVLQQMHAGCAFFLNFEFSKESPERFMGEYKRWLADARVGDYLDLAHPMYTPGRAPLGVLVDRVLRTGQDWLKVWDRDYAFAGFYFS